MLSVATLMADMIKLPGDFEPSLDFPKTSDFVHSEPFCPTLVLRRCFYSHTLENVDRFSPLTISHGDRGHPEHLHSTDMKNGNREIQKGGRSVNINRCNHTSDLRELQMENNHAPFNHAGGCWGVYMHVAVCRLQTQLNTSFMEISVQLLHQLLQHKLHQRSHKHRWGDRRVLVGQDRGVMVGQGGPDGTGQEGPGGSFSVSLYTNCKCIFFFQSVQPLPVDPHLLSHLQLIGSSSSAVFKRPRPPCYLLRWRWVDVPVLVSTRHSETCLCGLLLPAACFRPDLPVGTL